MRLWMLLFGAEPTSGEVARLEATKPTVCTSHVRPNDPASAAIVQAIVAMCLSERWQALDCSAGAFLERMANPLADLEQWTDYCNQMHNMSYKDSPPPTWNLRHASRYERQESSVMQSPQL